MESFKIITDTTADLPDSYLKENNLGCMFLPYMIDGETYTPGHEMDWREFYAKMRNGSMPTTSQVNPQEAEEYFRKALEENKNILYLAFSSGLSGTYNSGVIAANTLNEEIADANIVVVDSLCASLGEGMFAYKAVEQRKAGKSMDEVVSYLEEHKMNFTHVFTVDDLYHLYRGGRVSKSTAFFGTLANIKPLLHVDEEGHLTAVGKVRGRKKSLTSLVDMMEEKMGSYRDENKEMIMISHGDCLEDAEYLKEKIKERFGYEHFLINNVGPTVGAHSGPGTMALFFMGEGR